MLVEFEDYAPDEILMDIDSEEYIWPDEELHELSFEDARDAVTGISYLIDEVESPEELFSF